MASDENDQELEDLVRRLREIDSFLKSFLSSFRDDLSNDQINDVSSMVSEVEDAVKLIEQRPNRFMDVELGHPDTHPIRGLGGHLEKVTGVIEQTLESEVNAIETEFRDIIDSR